MGWAVPGALGSYNVRLEGCTDMDLTGVHYTCNCQRSLHVVSVPVVVIGDVCDLAWGPFAGAMLYPGRWGCVAWWLRSWRALLTQATLVISSPAMVVGFAC